MGAALRLRYDIFGDSKTIIRGGAGISYDRVQGNIAFDQIANPPTVSQPQLIFGRLQDLTPGQTGLEALSNVVGYAREGFLPTIYSMSLCNTTSATTRSLTFRTSAHSRATSSLRAS